MGFRLYVNAAGESCSNRICCRKLYCYFEPLDTYKSFKFLQQKFREDEFDTDIWGVGIGEGPYTLSGDDFKVFIRLYLDD